MEYVHDCLSVCTVTIYHFCITSTHFLNIRVSCYPAEKAVLTVEISLCPRSLCYPLRFKNPSLATRLTNAFHYSFITDSKRQLRAQLSCLVAST